MRLPYVAITLMPYMGGIEVIVKQFVVSIVTTKAKRVLIQADNAQDAINKAVEAKRMRLFDEQPEETTASNAKEVQLTIL